MEKPIFEFLTHAEICQEIGRVAKNRRKLSKLSRGELAAKSGVSVPTIARFENSGIATVGVMVKLAWALDATDTLSTLFAAPKYKSMDEFLQSEST